MQWDCRLSTGLPPSSLLCWLLSWKEDLQRAWNGDRRAVWDLVGLSHCRHKTLVTVRDEARLRRGHRNDQSNQGHQCSETTLTGESRFHISTPLGIEPGSLMTGSKRVVHWNSETLWECSEIAGFPQYRHFTVQIYPFPFSTVWKIESYCTNRWSAASGLQHPTPSLSIFSPIGSATFAAPRSVGLKLGKIHEF